MSTRATYTIKSKLYQGERTDHFYIHYDGYPEGAAVYFQNFVECANNKGGDLCRFIRANDLAEFTDNPGNHGDTEYHYEINRDQVSAWKLVRDWNDGSKDTKQMFFNGDLADFINKYLEQTDEYNKAFYINYKGRTITKKKLEAEYSAKFAQASTWHLSGHTGNAGSYLGEAYEIARFLGLDMTGVLALADLQAKAFGSEETGQAWLDRIHGAKEAFTPAQAERAAGKVWLK